MAPQTRKKITISILIPSLVFILFFTILIWQKYRSSHEIPATPPQVNVEGKKSVTLFFAVEGTRLAREAREIDPCEDLNSCLKDVLDELLNGPVGEYEETIPEGTVVESVSIEGNQVTVGLNGAFSEAMPSGSSAEMLAVYSIVDTVAVNFPQIQKVKINVDGNTAVVLSHLDLSDPLLPDYSLEQPSPPEPEKSSTGPATKRKGAP
ncbi:MAG: GerMN domain-containing protein [Pelobacteraceae bacterium]